MDGGQRRSGSREARVTVERGGVVAKTVKGSTPRLQLLYKYASWLTHNESMNQSIIVPSSLVSSQYNPFFFFFVRGVLPNELETLVEIYHTEWVRERLIKIVAERR